ncbi:hypothetical protein C8Q80DRAFT_1090864 [Daedaleopsis nitida]|nr:hypothetical protein C8Q80DRAFT_1090864 [Daedaleopsis nitida]
MATTPALTFTPEQQHVINELFESLEGAERARYLTISAFCLLVYDMMLTFDDEVQFFWSGEWNLSRVLFLLNRYFPPFVSMYVVPLSIIVLRICYVYSKSPLVRFFIVGCFAASTVSTYVVLGIVWHDMDSLPIPDVGFTIIGCNVPPSKQVWKIFLPNLVIHTILFLATTIPAMRMRRAGKNSQLTNRLVRDGGVFYFVVFVAAMFSAVGSLATNPLVTIAAIWSNLLLVLLSVSVSRLMLSIRSLAARLSVAPDWLLNNTELGRVNWKPGLRDGELIVEIDAIEDDEFELKSVGDESPTSKRPRTPVVHTTRVGVLEHSVYPGTRDYKAPPRLPKKKAQREFSRRLHERNDGAD